jgi:3-hydroxyisobutyrate dehydrogenase/putative dehydrogenase
VVGVVDETNRRIDEDHDRGARRVLRARRFRIGLILTAVMVVGYFGFILLIAFNNRGRRTVEGTEQVKSALYIFVKDMGLVVDAARQNTYPAPLASAAEQLYRAGRRAGLGRSDDSAVIEVLRGHRPPTG